MRAFTALVNPISGGGHAGEKWAPLAARISAAGADVRVESTRSREHAVAAARAAAHEGRVVVAVGGDGLVRDVAEGVVAVAGVMGIVPAGRGNDLARALGFPGDVAGLADLLVDGAAEPCDVIALGETIVLGNVYCGIDSVSNAIINRNRRLPPTLVYRLAPVRAILTWRAPRFTVTVDGEETVVRAHMVVVGNSGAYGHGLRIVPSARVDDGVLDVLVVGDGPKRAIASFMREAQHGTHVQRPEVSVRPAHEVTIAADRPVPVCGDGEYLAELPVTMRVRTGALRLIRP
ncbi:MAG TPA: YegS/Rv2252/BmrU family lipid kinase [Jatrophihabitans sp.]